MKIQNIDRGEELIKLIKKLDKKLESINVRKADIGRGLAAGISGYGYNSIPVSCNLMKTIMVLVENECKEDRDKAVQELESL